MVGIYQDDQRVRFVRVQNRTQHTLKVIVNKYMER